MLFRSQTDGIIYKDVNGYPTVALNDPERIQIDTMEFHVLDASSVKKRVALVLKGSFIGVNNNQNQPISLYTTIFQRI